jgi:ABC-type nitrate/sulfonate/bicarbonate transport system ATPase subunit
MPEPERTATALTRTLFPQRPARPAATVAIARQLQQSPARGLQDGVDFHVAAGELVAVLGVEGSGKKALLMALAGLDDLNGGLVDVASRRAVVLSPHGLVAWKRVLGNVRFGSRLRDDHEAREALECVGIAHLAHRWPGELDAEETFRVLLARALTQYPALVLLDEPFSRLSFAASERMHSVVRELARSHDLAIVVTTDDAIDALATAATGVRAVSA